MAYDDPMAAQDPPPTGTPSPDSAPRHNVDTPPSPWVSLMLGFRWPLALIVVAGLIFLVYRETLRQGEAVVTGTVDALARGAENISRNLLTGNVTESFLAAIPKIQNSGGGKLEVATAEAVETFQRSDERRVLWDAFSLGTTVSEIQVPVTYRYHLRLEDPWRIEVSGPICTVYAPQIRATQPPAIHTERMRKRVQEDLLRFDGDDQMTILEKSITPRLRQMAQNPQHIDLVRDKARETVREFVRQWLRLEDQWGDDGIQVIQVVFPEETDPASAAATAPDLPRG